MKSNSIIIGTRGSKLALWQAQQVKDRLIAAFPHLSISLQIIKTKGDKILDVALSKIGDKGLFTKEIELALSNGEIDMAVHSLKDLPTELPEGLAVGGILKREEVRDVLISTKRGNLSELTASDKVGTSSLRRKAQLLYFTPDIQVVDIRGNVETRIQKMQDGYCDALIMAAAGIIRLGYQDIIKEYIDPEIIMPAVAQGAIAMEIREDDDKIRHFTDSITDEISWYVSMAERSFLRALEGGCQVPIGCYCKVNNGNISISGMVAKPDGSMQIKRSIDCMLEEASEKAIELAETILNEGGQKILDDIRK